MISAIPEREAPVGAGFSDVAVDGRVKQSGGVVVQTSRGGAGRIARRRYLREQGMVAGDNLNAQKARVLLMLALTQTSDPEAVQRLFDTY